MKLLLTPLITLITLITPINPTFAADSSPSADQLRQSNSEASIKAKLKSLQEEIASKASKLKQEVGKKLQNKAYVGIVKTKSDDSFTLTTKKDTQKINTNQYTEFIGKKFTFKALTDNDYIVALGDIDETGVLTAKRIIKLTAPVKLEKKFVFGQIMAINGKTLTLQTKDNQKLDITPVSGTEKLKTGNKVITLGNKVIYISDLGISPVASPTASPSAKPKR